MYVRYLPLSFLETRTVDIFFMKDFNCICLQFKLPPLKNQTPVQSISQMINKLQILFPSTQLLHPRMKVRKTIGKSHSDVQAMSIPQSATARWSGQSVNERQQAVASRWRARLTVRGSGCTGPLLKVPPYCHREEEKNHSSLPVGVVPHRLLLTASCIWQHEREMSPRRFFAAPFPGQRSLPDWQCLGSHIDWVLAPHRTVLVRTRRPTGPPGKQRGVQMTNAPFGHADEHTHNTLQDIHT